MLALEELSNRTDAINDPSPQTKRPQTKNH